MTLHQLIEQTRLFPIFSIEDCRKWFPKISRKTLILELFNYTKKRYLIRLKRGLYLLNQKPLPNPFVIASRLQTNSVISLESVLHQAGLIPEIPFVTTAVTPFKTARYTIPQVGSFIFRHLKPKLIFGWRSHKFPPYIVKTALSEKALLDLFWFHRFEPDPKSYIKELRLSIPKSFKRQDFIKFSRIFNDSRISLMAKLIIQSHQR